MGNKVMSIESVICLSLNYASASGWDSFKQTEFAAKVVQRLRPDWTEEEVLCAVDWVRSQASGDLQAI